MTTTTGTHWKFNTKFVTESGSYFKKKAIPQAELAGRKVAISATDFLDLTPLTGVVKNDVVPIFESAGAIMEQRAKSIVKVDTGKIRDSIKGYSFISKKGDKVVAAVKSTSGDGLWLEIGVNHASGPARKHKNRLRVGRKIKSNSDFSDFTNVSARIAKRRMKSITDALGNITTQEAQPYLRPAREEGIKFITDKLSGMYGN